MSVFRGTGKVANTLLGEAARGGVKIISNEVATKNEKAGRYLGELGESVMEASKFADGTV